MGGAGRGGEGGRVGEGDGGRVKWVGERGTSRWSDSPLHWSEDPLVRKCIIGPKMYHWSENHWSKKVCHWSGGSLVRKSPIDPENPLVRKIVISPKIAGPKGRVCF